MYVHQQSSTVRCLTAVVVLAVAVAAAARGDQAQVVLDGTMMEGNVPSRLPLDALKQYYVSPVSFEAVLEVLPVSKAFTGIELEGDVAAQGSDFELLENLRRLAYSDKVDEPQQLDLWKD